MKMNWSLRGLKFKLVLTRKMIRDGARRSKGYGFAWRDFDTASLVTYPIPFNVLFRSLRQFWHWILSHKNSVLDEARIKGIHEGQELAEAMYRAQRRAAEKLSK